MNLLKLNHGQIAKLADMSSEVAVVALASVVLPAVLDHVYLLRVLFGIVATIFFWVFSLWLLKTQS